MICPKGWMKSLLIVLWEDRGLIWRNFKKEIRRALLRGR